MNKLCFATLALCLVAANAADSNPNAPTGPALIDQVCKNMTNKDLCRSTLTKDPGSKHADLTKLTLISIRIASYMALETYTYAYAKQQDKFDVAVSNCYSDCAENYSGAMEQLDDSYAALIAKKYADVKKMIESAMLFEDACQVCFKATTHTKTISEPNKMFRNLAMNAVSLVDALQVAKH